VCPYQDIDLALFPYHDSDIAMCPNNGVDLTLYPYRDINLAVCPYHGIDFVLCPYPRVDSFSGLLGRIISRIHVKGVSIKAFI
jgi:hypothetical protein